MAMPKEPFFLKSMGRNIIVYTTCINGSIEDGLSVEEKDLILFFNLMKYFKRKECLYDCLDNI